MQSLLISESPYIFFGLTAGTIFLFDKHKYGSFLCILIIILLFIFYRYESINIKFPDNVIVSPAEGLITNIHQSSTNVHISIFLSIFNKHTQIYPVNGTVVNRVYDRSGKFDIVIKMDKSRFNEKKFHTMEMKNGNKIIVTQIAGFCPRAINSSNKFPEEVNAGDYLGIIKFGSRVDLLFPGDMRKVKFKEGDDIKLGDIIYEYS